MPGHDGCDINLITPPVAPAYGKIEALKSVDLDINRGEIRARPIWKAEGGDRIRAILSAGCLGERRDLCSVSS
jgi:hypothetical protein